VSTSRQENEQTIETQIGVLKEYATKNDYTIVQEYKDDGWSGDMLARPALDRLRQDAKEKIWEAVLIYDPDRLARRYSYQELVMDELKEAGIEIIFVTISAPKNDEDKILHGVRGLFAEYERAKISERFRLGKLRKVKEGHLLVSEALYGYRYILKQEKIHGYYEINDTEANVVRRIFKWVAEEGITLRSIVRKLQELGIKPRRSKRGVWNTSTLSHLLRNKAYIGEAHWGSSYAVIPTNPQNTEKYKKMKKSSRRIKPEGEWVATKIPVPAIIDRDTFFKAQDRLKTNYALSRRNKINEYLFGGKIYCTCGRRRVGEGPQHGKHLYYRCTDRVLSSPLPPTCKEKSLNARIVDKLVWDKIEKLMTSSELLDKQIKHWLNNKKKTTESPFGDLNIIEKEIIKLKDIEDRYNKAYGAGLLTMEQLREYSTQTRERIATLEAQILEIKQQEEQTNTNLPNQNEIESFAEESKEVLRELNFEKKRGIVISIINKIIGTKEKLQVFGHLPVLDINKNVEYITSCRNCGVAKCGEINIVSGNYQKTSRLRKLSILHHRAECGRGCGSG